MDHNTPIPFVDWFDSRFRLPNGKAYTAQTRRLFVRRYRLPVIRVGMLRFIVPSAADAAIAKLPPSWQQPEEPQQQRRGRGRPRKLQAAE